MTRKARIWIGITLLIVLALNYALIAYPLVKKSVSLRDKMRKALISQALDDEYFLEIYRKEKLAVDRKILLVNCVALSFGIIVVSWTAFGIIAHRKKV